MSSVFPNFAEGSSAELESRQFPIRILEAGPDWDNDVIDNLRSHVETAARRSPRQVREVDLRLDESESRMGHRYTVSIDAEATKQHFHAEGTSRSPEKACNIAVSRLRRQFDSGHKRQQRRHKARWPQRGV